MPAIWWKPQVILAVFFLVMYLMTTNAPFRNTWKENPIPIVSVWLFRVLAGYLFVACIYWI